MSNFFNETFVANVDLSGGQYKFVSNSGNLLVGLTATAGGESIGILQNKPEIGEHATVTYLGRSRCIAGGTIAAGNLITSDTTGTATAVASGGYVVGTALTAVASGETFQALITNAGYKGQ